MSPRAAARLEQLGFSDVWDYLPGKNDWLAFDLPYEGEAVLASAAVDRDVPRCRLEERVGAVAERVGADTDLVVVIDEQDVVMGILEEGVLAKSHDATAEAAMRFGVTTVRPNEEMEALVHRMDHRNTDLVLMTRHDGVLVGLFRRAEGEAHLEALE